MWRKMEKVGKVKLSDQCFSVAVTALDYMCSILVKRKSDGLPFLLYEAGKK